MRVVDLTEKLNRAEKPVIRVSDVDIEVDNSAKTMLKVLQAVGDDEITPQKAVDVYNLIFDKANRAKVEKLELDFDSFAQLIATAMELISGGAEGEAAAGTLDTTS